MAPPGYDEVLAELPAQIRYAHVEQVGQGRFVFVEEVVVKRGARDYLPVMQREVFQHCILARQQRHRLPLAPRAALRDIDHDLAKIQPSAGAGGPAPDQRAQAREQLRKVEGFHDVIIRAAVQAAHAVCAAVACRQHEHRGLLRLPQACQQRPAVKHREHRIQQDRVVVVVERLLQPFTAIRRRVHGIAFPTQDLREPAQHVGFVFDNQETHDRKNTRPARLCHLLV